MSKKYFDMNDIKFALDMDRNQESKHYARDTVNCMRRWFDPAEFSEQDIQQFALDTADMSVDGILKEKERRDIKNDIEALGKQKDYRYIR